MSRYAQMFERLAGEGAFGAFLMLGDPDPNTSPELLDSVVAGGADMVEVGFPFSDPIADGPVIQAAATRAQKAGVQTADCFRIIADFRARHPDVPVGILTYANLVMARGRADFFSRAAQAGADSLLVADLPSIEAGPWTEEMIASGIEPVLIAASNSPPQTLDRVAALSRAYVYCVTRAGVTGTHSEAHFDAGLIASLKGGPPPIFGFGISTTDHVRAALRVGAAGVICGSAIVDCAARGGDVRSLVAALKAGTRNDSAPD
jgi:tryptophan synthase alpha chain